MESLVVRLVVVINPVDEKETNMPSQERILERLTDDIYGSFHVDYKTVVQSVAVTHINGESTGNEDLYIIL